MILDDASAESPFSADPYISQQNARSILCLPLINQTKLIGMLYLENNLAPRVFAPSRIAVLKVLASQAAISLENSRLYGDLQEQEAKIRTVHRGCIAMEASLHAKTGRIHGCTRTLRKTSDSSCTAGAVHTWPHRNQFGSCNAGVARTGGWSLRARRVGHWLLNKIRFTARTEVGGMPVAIEMVRTPSPRCISCATSNRRRIVSARVPGRFPGFSAETVLAGSGAF